MSIPMHGEVLRMPIPMPLMGAVESGSDLRVTPPVEIQFTRRFVSKVHSPVDSYIFLFACETCASYSPRKVGLYTSPLFEWNGTGNIPDNIWEWIVNHSEMHRIIGQWGKALARV